MRTISTMLAILGTSLTATAEIQKFAVPCEQTMCFCWWPKLPPLKGWEQDREHSFHYSVNALVPNGSSFSNADVVMYAKAVYKPRQPEATSLAVLIEHDRAEFIENVPGVKIAEVDPITTGGGAKLRSLIFTPPESGGNWEQVS